MSLLIKKTVKLDFLGEDYKDSYLTFRAIPIKDFEKIQEETEKIGDDGKKSIAFISEKLSEYYVSGKAANESGVLEDVTKDDLGNLDQVSVVKCFEVLTGQNISEESDFLDKDSKAQSSTTEDSPSKS